MAEGNGSQVTVKDLLSMMRDESNRRFDRLESLLDRKADDSDLEKLEKRLDDLELKALTPEKVGDQIAIALQESKARGWTTRERFLGAAVGTMTLVSLVLNLLTR